MQQVKACFRKINCNTQSIMVTSTLIQVYGKVYALTLTIDVYKRQGTRTEGFVFSATWTQPAGRFWNLTFYGVRSSDGTTYCI